MKIGDDKKLTVLTRVYFKSPVDCERWRPRSRQSHRQARSRHRSGNRSPIGVTDNQFGQGVAAKAASDIQRQIASLIVAAIGKSRPGFGLQFGHALLQQRPVQTKSAFLNRRAMGRFAPGEFEHLVSELPAAVNQEISNAPWSSDQFAPQRAGPIR
jgi:hypothetical protein